MKNIALTIAILFIGLPLLPSCTEIDNYDSPNARMNGRLIDSTTGKNFVTGQGEFNIRIWEMSWSDNPTPQDIPVKQDGTFNNTKLFSATYDMQPYGGPFWPVEKHTGVKLSGSLTKDFEVTPYLQIVDFDYQLNGTTLRLSCRLKAPITANLPRVLELRPFLSLTQYCGDGSKIEEYNQDIYRLAINANWSEDIGDANGEGSKTYVLPDIPLKTGRTYYVRVGARVEDTYRKYNYSEIVTIKP